MMNQKTIWLAGFYFLLLTGVFHSKHKVSIIYADTTTEVTHLTSNNIPAKSGCRYNHTFKLHACIRGEITCIPSVQLISLRKDNVAIPQDILVHWVSLRYGGHRYNLQPVPIFIRTRKLLI
jgi:hypothetical protein